MTVDFDRYAEVPPHGTAVTVQCMSYDLNVIQNKSKKIVTKFQLLALLGR